MKYLMPILCLVWFAMFTKVAYARSCDASHQPVAYYIDSVGGNDASSGKSPLLPWKSLNKLQSIEYSLRGGDTINIKAGSSFVNQNTANNYGMLQIYHSGCVALDGQPQYITYQAYGDLAASGKPKLVNTSWKWGIFVEAEYIKVNDLYVESHLPDNSLGRAGIYMYHGDLGYGNNYFSNIEVANSGAGIEIEANQNVVENGYFHDLIMENNTPIAVASDDDYGAVGVIIKGSNNEVKNNKMVRCKATSYDYSKDGGATEIFSSSQANGNYIHHNYSYLTDGFLEIGGSSVTSQVNDNIISFNAVVDSGSLAWIHYPSDTTNFGVSVKRTTFANNTIVNNSGSRIRAMGMAGTPSTPNDLLLVNNIFDWPAGEEVRVESEIVGGTYGEFAHHHNIFTKVNTAFGIGLGELVTDPRLIPGDWRLNSDSPAINAGDTNWANNIGADQTTGVAPTPTPTPTPMPDIISPTVNIISPLNQTLFPANTVVNVVSNISDNANGSGIKQVDFYLNNKLQATLNVTPYVFQFVTCQVCAKKTTYKIMLKATDYAGNAKSSTVTVYAK